jgi:hypothetical protein
MSEIYRVYHFVSAKNPGQYKVFIYIFNTYKFPDFILVMQQYTEIPYTAIFSRRFGTRYVDFIMFMFIVSVLYKLH